MGLANFVNNWGYFILLAWMPLYFKQVVGLELAKSSYFSALPWATMVGRGGEGEGGGGGRGHVKTLPPCYK